MTQQKRQAQRNRADDRTPLLEWIASGVGLLLTLFMLGAIGWEAASGGADRPPSISVSVGRMMPVESGFAVEVVADNRSAATAAAVQIEGKLTRSDGSVETSSVTLDYVPGDSTRKAGLFFTGDPRRSRLEVRTLGFVRP